MWISFTLLQSQFHQRVPRKTLKCSHTTHALFLSEVSVNKVGVVVVLFNWKCRFHSLQSSVTVPKTEFPEGKGQHCSAFAIFCGYPTGAICSSVLELLSLTVHRAACQWRLVQIRTQIAKQPLPRCAHLSTSDCHWGR